MGTKAENVTLVDNAFTVEVLAMLQAMVFARDLGFTKMEIEEDALCVIKKMQNLENDFSPIGNIIDEARIW